MKHEWQEIEKDVYLPETKPVIIDIPKYKFLTIEGKGNSESESYTENVVALYAMSYGIKTCKRAIRPKDYFDYTVYPVEAIWSNEKEANELSDDELDTDNSTYKLMIRQPDFVTTKLVDEIRTIIKEKKQQDIFDNVIFEEIEEGKCVQSLHLGSYKEEEKTFKIMDDFATKSGIKRSSKTHRKIYLSDARKAHPEALQTVLRFQVEAL